MWKVTIFTVKIKRESEPLVIAKCNQYIFFMIMQVINHRIVFQGHFKKKYILKNHKKNIKNIKNKKSVISMLLTFTIDVSGY